MRLFVELFIVFLILVSPIVFSVAYRLSGHQETITIVDKDRTVYNDGEKVTSKYLIYTPTAVYENTDSLVFFKFNSADVQSALRRGRTYCVKVAGWRIPVLSMFKNIIDVIHQGKCQNHASRP